MDTDHWEDGPDGYSQTLLHRALDESNETAASFLIRSGCDVNSPRRPIASDSEDDRSTPLHMCASWGLVSVAATLLEHGADINPRDAEGKTPLHAAVEQHHDPVVQLLLHQVGVDVYTMDRTGRTPFGAALAVKNNKAARMVLNRDPSVAEQVTQK